MAANAHLFDPDSDPEVDRLLNDSPPPVRRRRTLQRVDEWCTCGHCERKPLEEENVCCQEIHKVRRRMRELDEADRPACMTEHPGLEAVCFNVFVLQAALAMYNAEHGRLRRRRSLHRRYRYLAYRMFVAWCWGHMGRNIRVVLPSCVVSHVRRRHPENSNIYTGFRRRALG